jgi:predicted ester cyclase
VGIEENKQLISNFYEGFNAKDLDKSFEKFVSPDLKVHALGKTLDRNEWINMDKDVFSAFSEFKITIIDQIAEGDKVVTMGLITGIHTGEFKGRPASGNKVGLNIIAVDRLFNGKIVEHWAEMDFSGFLQQLIKTEI